MNVSTSPPFLCNSKPLLTVVGSDHGPPEALLSVANRMWNMSEMDSHRNRGFLPKPIEAATFLGEFSFRPIAETVSLLR